ncbi:MAG: helix-turn-helix transcriptional regulator [Clostridia bacterium]|nr:helix-turn-helix transcriptional regulator [Clostridia bacterium]
MRKPSIFNDGKIDFRLTQIDYNLSKEGSYKVGMRDRRTSCELIYKLDGSSTQRFGGNAIELVPDSIYFIPVGSTNTFTVHEPGTVVNIHFELYTEDGGAGFPPELIALAPGNPYKSKFLRAAEIWRKKEPGYYLHAHALAAEILAGLVAEREQHYRQSAKYAIIEPALLHIRAHYHEPISVAALAELCGISDQYLRTLFKNFAGQTPVAYINTLRLEQARELLQSGGVTVAEAAEACGFESPGYFARMFKKRYNISPGSLSRTEISLPDIYNKEEFKL